VNGEDMEIPALSLSDDIINFDNLLAVLLTLTLFGWLGWRRGARSEWTMFTVALLSYVLLFAGQDRIVTITENVPKVFSMLLGSDEATTATTTAVAPAATTAPTFADALSDPGVQDAYIIIIWFAIIFFTYILTSLKPFNRKPHHNFWAVLAGILNGYLFIYIFVPKLGEFYTAAMPTPQTGVLSGFTELVRLTGELLASTVQRLWQLLLQPNPLVLLAVFTILLAIAAMSLRRGAKAKS
jgi:hypothetical protein